MTQVMPPFGSAGWLLAPQEAPPVEQPKDGDGLLDQLLREQQDLSAVERFAGLHEHADTPAQAKWYRSLLPAAPPGPGQQYAFEVDLDRCSGCKSCVAACHSMNGLDEGEAWRDVGLLTGGTSGLPVLQHVTTACHHCLEPACMIACPVNAYEKDPLTGIVKHLDDQCFGCQYCTLACPYDVPKYHAAKGIVRKCDMCSSRLAAGEAPACVQSCPHEAIRIRVVDVRQVEEDAEAAVFLPAAPDPQFTLPTTTFRTSRVFPRNMLPADYFDVAPQHPHLPLVVMLVLTQLSVGAFLAGFALRALEPHLPMSAWDSFHAVHAGGALFFGLLALAASTFHLGRPQYAFRAVLGIRHSWLSREIVCFGLFAVAAGLYATAVTASSRWPALRGLAEPLAWAVAISGLAGVFCSGMLYVFTRRETWSAAAVGVRFALTTLLLGVAACWLSLLLTACRNPDASGADLLRHVGPLGARLIMTLTAAKLIWDGLIFRHLLSRRMTGMRRSALLMTRELSNVTLARFAAGAWGGLFMPALLLHQLSDAEPLSLVAIWCVAILVAACLIGELLERYLFFAAATNPRMPGAVR
ncbi:MAG: dimethyl sulfoxide reductase anchor subunit [Planctomycetales bacterium]|nr:dimethyl sulfoxide reductase anchor subunit [Planctomycetales bacterium]